VSRTSAALYDNDGRPLPEIARALGVDFIVDGSVIRAEGRVRITARLIDGRRDEHVFAEFYDRPLRPVLSVQAQVAGAIAHAIKVALASHSRSRQASRRAEARLAASDPQPALTRLGQWH
jgi:TolB-like protein